MKRQKRLSRVISLLLTLALVLSFLPTQALALGSYGEPPDQVAFKVMRMDGIRTVNFTCCGFWKSYGDPAEMQVCFACYRRCIQTYVAMFEQGIPIERLAVPA